MILAFLHFQVRIPSLLNMTPEQVSAIARAITVPTSMILADEGAIKLWPKWPLKKVAEMFRIDNDHRVRRNREE